MGVDRPASSSARNLLAVLLLLLLLLLPVGVARGAVLFDTLNQNSGFDPALKMTTASASYDPQFLFYYSERSATKFNVTGGPYALTSVSLPIESASQVAVPLCVRVRRDDAGIPGTILEEFACNATWPVLGSPPTLTTLISNHQPQMEAGTYWIETVLTGFPGPGQGALYRWYAGDGPLLYVAVDVTPWIRPADEPWGSQFWIRHEQRAFRVEGVPAGSVGVDPMLTARTELAIPNPTPFRGDASIGFSLAESGPVKIAVFSVTGARVRTLAHGVRTAGADQVAWDGRDERGQVVPAGMYIVRLEAAGKRLQRRLIKLD